MSRKKREKLTGKTPKWFEDWHNEQFVPVRETSKSNKRWIYIIVAAIVTAAASGNFDFNTIAECIASAVGA